ncbi:MAG: SPOR domain-containing protein [Ferruginibacter sp.]
MKKILLFALMTIMISAIQAQINNTDSSAKPMITVNKDDRIEILGKKMAEYNEGLANKIRLEKGYRLIILSTTDRAQAIQVRAKLMQLFPDQNVYMTFASPYIKLKFGDFLLEDDADKMKKQIAELKIVSGNIYVVPEMVEVKPDKNKQPAADD